MATEINSYEQKLEIQTHRLPWHEVWPVRQQGQMQSLSPDEGQTPLDGLLVQMKILRDSQPAEGSGQPPAPAPANAAPPVTAKIVANGKTERELLLEKQNQRLVKVARATVAEKKKVEEHAAHVQRENEQLRQQQQQTAAKQKSSWLGFT